MVSRAIVLLSVVAAAVAVLPNAGASRDGAVLRAPQRRAIHAAMSTNKTLFSIFPSVVFFRGACTTRFSRSERHIVVTFAERWRPSARRQPRAHMWKIIERSDGRPIRTFSSGAFPPQSVR
jgi:hypothetical protein